MADLQFETAEYQGGAAPCAVCHGALGARWWMTGGHHICTPCHDRLDAAFSAPGTSAQFGWAALYGGGAALASSVGWYAIREATGLDLGIVAIGVAIFVSWAIKQGGGGGFAQQILAVVLTYLAVVMSWVPMFLATALTEASDATGVVAGIVVSAGLAIGLPAVMASGGNFIWFLMVGIALWSAYRRAARPQILWTGPFDAGSPPPAAPSVAP
jgi:hypothetical protein